MSNGPLCRVLSIQGHPVYGYAGTKSSTFPLQVLGFDVDIINAVQFSNHPEYKYFQGQVFSDGDLRKLFDGLKLNNIHHYSHLLTGYVGSKSFLEEVVKVLDDLREANPDLVYVCDPVMGDSGQFYTEHHEALLQVYMDHLIPKADIITPNQFEAEILTGTKINTEKDAFKTMNLFHDKGIKTVVITSSELKNDQLVTLASSHQDGKYVRIRMEVPKLEMKFTGTGDMFASLFLAWTYKHPKDLEVACEKTISTIQTVLKRTAECAKQKAKADGDPNRKPTVAEIELKLIQSLDDIRDATVIYQAEEVSY